MILLLLSHQCIRFLASICSDPASIKRMVGVFNRFRYNDDSDPRCPNPCTYLMVDVTNIHSEKKAEVAKKKKKKGGDGVKEYAKLKLHFLSK